MRFIFEQVRVGGDRNFSYILGDRSERKAVIVDPSFDPAKVLSRCEAQGLEVSSIITTHGHHDHVNGNEEARSRTGAPVLASEHASFTHQISVTDGEIIKVGEFPIRFLYTPGHADDHLVILVDSHQIILSADLVFVGKVGGTSSEENARLQWESIQKLLKETSDSYTIWPGHDYGCRPSSTVFLERNSNPFLQADSFEEFIRVKNQWANLKSSHGLL
jgi:hydroxyacylglutathione hydrolase